MCVHIPAVKNANVCRASLATFLRLHTALTQFQAEFHVQLGVHLLLYVAVRTLNLRQVANGCSLGDFNQIKNLLQS